MSECKLIERIDVLKESEAIIRAERQELEMQVRHMMFERLQAKGAES